MLKEDNPYESLEYRSKHLQEELVKAAKAVNVPFKVNRVGTMLTAFFSEGEVTNFEESKKSDQAKFSRYFKAMLNEGVYLPPSAFECWFISTAHTESIIEQTIEAHKKALAVL